MCVRELCVSRVACECKLCVRELCGSRVVCECESKLCV